MKKLFHNLSLTWDAWNEDQALTLGAALSYYVIFSIAPLVLIAVAIAGLVWGQDASRGEIFGAMSGLLGDQGAKAVQSFVEASSLKNAGVLATVIGIITLIVGSTSAFAQLQDSLNMIWKVKRRPGRGITNTLRQRLLSFSLILVIALLLLVSLLLSAILSALGKLAVDYLPGGQVIWYGIDLVVSFALTSLLFSAIYKILPDVKLAWRDVFWGGLVTALFFTLGRFLIGFYIGHAAVASTFGAAGSVVIILVWAYYSSAVLFFGAEYTKIHALGVHPTIPLKAGAEWVDVPLSKTVYEK